MKIREGFVKREVMGETVVVPTGDAGKEFKGMIRLNETARFIWDRIEEGKTPEETAKAISETYEVDIEKAKADVEKIVREMQAANIIES